MDRFVVNLIDGNAAEDLYDWLTKMGADVYVGFTESGEIELYDFSISYNFGKLETGDIVYVSEIYFAADKPTPIVSVQRKSAKQTGDNEAILYSEIGVRSNVI